MLEGVVLIALMSAIVFIILGCLIRLFPPKTQNSSYGYRSFMSMKNQETWNEAQKYAGLTMIIFGLINLFLGLWAILTPIILNSEIVQFVVLVIGTLAVIYINEARLRDIFTEEGKRK